jgi:hypothetical protein
MTCIKPNCNGHPAVRPDHSTLMYELYYCETCQTTFRKPTLLGQICGFAPAVIASCAVFGAWGGHGGHHHGATWTDGNDSF